MIDLENGWVKSWRKSIRHKYYKSPLIWHLWNHLILRANYAHNDVFFNYRDVSLEPGQLIVGRMQLANETGLSERQVRTALARLSDTKQNGGPLISIKATKAFSVVTVLNYERYQGNTSDECPTDVQRVSKDRPTDVQRPTTDKKEKKNKERKEEEERERFLHPQKDEPQPVEELVLDSDPEKPKSKPKPKTKTPRKEHDEAIDAFRDGGIAVPAHLDTEQFRELFLEWASRRLTVKKNPVTKRILERELKKLQPYSMAEAVSMAERAASSSYLCIRYDDAPPPGQVLNQQKRNPYGPQKLDMKNDPALVAMRETLRQREIEQARRKQCKTTNANVIDVDSEPF